MKVSDIQFILDKMDDRQLRHSNNTACLCYAMGQAINCPAEELSALWFSGLLLESGKLWITNKIKMEINCSFEDDFDILNKKEKLVNYTLYTQAVLRSLESLENKVDFSSVIAIIDQAEENVDGSGYPRHLKAANIDTLSKVLRIAAFYDNCRLDEMTHEDACKELQKYADKYFPPKIIEPFIKSVEDNEMHKDYCEERNWTIGQLTEEEQAEKTKILKSMKNTTKSKAKVNKVQSKK